MKEIKVTPYDCVEEVVKEALAKANRQSWCGDIGFVGNADFIQDVLRVVLQNTDYGIDVIDIDTYDYGDIYQLTIDTEDFVSVLPISTDNGYITFSNDRLYVSDEVPISYIRTLDDNGAKYKVIGFDYENYEDDSDSDSGDLEAMYSTYNRTSDPIQQLNDFMFDCFLYLTQKWSRRFKKLTERRRCVTVPTHR